jgi:hypothetical protein
MAASLDVIAAIPIFSMTWSYFGPFLRKDLARRVELSRPILPKRGPDGKARSQVNAEIHRLCDLRADRDRPDAAPFAAQAMTTDAGFKTRAAPWGTIGVSHGGN